LERIIARLDPFMLALTLRDIFELLDLIPASTVVRVAAKDSKGFLLNPSKFWVFGNYRGIG
jgi:hypothetical protein